MPLIIFRRWTQIQQGETSAIKFGVEFVPTILLVDTDGNELQRSGFVDAEQLLKVLPK
ncbi:thioredoxin family protein [Novipirellula sp.]|uniref:thioredoxin family protein n=1 Tax=Novipirellula sp. TaxID=2795430 RepID=UPI003563955E